MQSDLQVNPTDLPLKWPHKVTVIRHAQSQFNHQKSIKEADRWYQLFRRCYDSNPESFLTWVLAHLLQNRWSMPFSDADTPLTPLGQEQAYLTGKRLPEIMDLPKAIMLSPYLRTRQTLAGLIQGWPKLGEVRQITDMRLREQRHGLALLYSDWRIFNTLHPLQRRLRQIEGPYAYAYPQGDSAEDLCERIMGWLTTLIREFSEEEVLAISHHLTSIAIMATLFRWSPEQFIEQDNREKPRNCSVTMFVGIPGAGHTRQGKLELASYNQIYY